MVFKEPFTKSYVDIKAMTGPKLKARRISRQKGPLYSGYFWMVKKR